MFGLVEPYSGHFFVAEYIEYDSENKTYKVPILIHIKGASEIGVSSGVREQSQVQDINGRLVIKETFKVNVVEEHDYKVGDRVRFLQEDKTYTVYKASDDITHPNNMSALMFTNSKKRPYTLNLGE